MIQRKPMRAFSGLVGRAVDDTPSAVLEPAPILVPEALAVQKSPFKRRGQIRLAGSPRRTNAEYQQVYRERQKEKKARTEEARLQKLRKEIEARLALGEHIENILSDVVNRPAVLKIFGPVEDTDVTHTTDYLNAVSRGRFLIKAPAGTGLLITGGYNSTKIDIVTAAHMSQAEGHRVRPEGSKADGDGWDKDRRKFLVNLKPSTVDDAVIRLLPECFDLPELIDGQYCQDAVFHCKLCPYKTEYIREARNHIRDTHPRAVNSYIRGGLSLQRKLTKLGKKVMLEHYGSARTVWAAEQRENQEIKRTNNTDQRLLPGNIRKRKHDAEPSHVRTDNIRKELFEADIHQDDIGE